MGSLINNLRGGNISAPRQHFLSYSADDETVANLFNQSFSSILRLRKQQPSTRTLTDTLLNSAYLPLLSLHELRSIFNLKTNKLPGFVKILISDLQRNFDAIKLALLSLLNCILDAGVIPVEIKTAIVIPLHK